LGDEWERYLRQQIELGGSEVVLESSPILVELSPAEEQTSPPPRLPAECSLLPVSSRSRLSGECWTRCSLRFNQTWRS
jgi:hypothetical protein